MNRDGDKSAKTALRSQKQPRAQQVCVQKKKRDQSSKDAQGVSVSKDAPSAQCDSGTRAEKVSSTGATERSPAAQRKLSDASNASEDLSKDSGCLSGKLSSSDSSSEISDCPSEGNKNDCPSRDGELSWVEGHAYVSPDTEGRGPRKTDAPQVDAARGALGLFNSSGAFMELMMGETSEDLVREVEDLKSENEYLKDEVEELRCEMLEMRDMFQEEEVYQLQELRQQLEQANKMCRILHYRLRKAERRSIRVAQTGLVDGELVRSLEHDIKMAKSVSFRLCSELEAVQKKNSQLEWENETLREKTQELEVAKQVLQAEVEKAKEFSLKKKNIRSTVSRAEKRLSQQLEDDSADLKCQLHFAKEELALMCKKLTKLVSESEGMREELAKYRSAYGDVDVAQSPEGKHSSARAREAEVKIHLKLVEEEATLLSRRIVELEVENRGLRAEMSDLREKTGGGEDDEQENRDVSASTPAKASKGREQQRGQREETEKGTSDAEATSLCSRLQTEGRIAPCHITRDGPVGGEWDRSDSQEGENNKILNRGVKGMTVKESLLALRDHSCILSSAIQLLTKPPKHSHCSSPSCAFSTEVESNGKGQKMTLPGPLNEALELLQTMLLAFIKRVETLFTGEDLGNNSVWDSCASAVSSGDGPDHVENVSNHKEECTTAFKESATRQAPCFQWNHSHGCKDPKTQLSLKILWILHQWCQVQEQVEGDKHEERSTFVLRGLLQDVEAELRDEQKEFVDAAKATQACECAGTLHHEHQGEADRMRSSNRQRLRRQFSPCSSKRRNWCYVSQEAAQLDREDPVKTWHHLIMPLSFPDLDVEQMSVEKSHTAPERSTLRIYYSPPSARRVRVAQQKQGPVVDGEPVPPLASFPELSLCSSANLSDDMKQTTTTWRQTGQGSSQEKRLAEQWPDVACSDTRPHPKPQMVSVALPTEGAQGSVSVKNSPSRVLASSLLSARSHHISTSLDGVTGRMERPIPRSTSSPKLYRRHSASGGPSLTSSISVSSSTPSLSPSRGRALWNLNHHSHAGLTLTKQASRRAVAGQNHSSLSSAKPPSKPAGINRYGLVSEFLRRVSGRGEKAAPDSGQKVKGGPKNLERVPTRPPTVPPHRNDSVTRIVNQRFMKQREEASRGQREERGSGLGQSVKRTTTAEDGNYDGCSSTSTLTFCLPRPSRSAQRQTLSHSKGARHRYSAPVNTAVDSNCE